MWMPGADAGAFTVIAKYRAQSRRGQRLSAMNALGDDEQRLGICLGALDQQISLDRAGNVGVDRYGPFLASLAEHPNPASGDIHIGNAH